MNCDLVATGKTREDGAKQYRCSRSCRRGPFFSKREPCDIRAVCVPRGLGDMLAAGLEAVGVPPCSGCGGRIEWFNKLGRKIGIGKTSDDQETG